MTTFPPEIRELIERVIVPALLERFLREHERTAQTSLLRAAAEPQQVECRPTP